MSCFVFGYCHDQMGRNEGRRLRPAQAGGFKRSMRNFRRAATKRGLYVWAKPKSTHVRNCFAALDKTGRANR